MPILSGRRRYLPIQRHHQTQRGQGEKVLDTSNKLCQRQSLCPFCLFKLYKVQRFNIQVTSYMYNVWHDIITFRQLQSWNYQWFDWHFLFEMRWGTILWFCQSWWYDDTIKDTDCDGVMLLCNSFGLQFATIDRMGSLRPCPGHLRFPDNVVMVILLICPYLQQDSVASTLPWYDLINIKLIS